MPNSYLNAREAAAELNVSRATLYAYVSRGLIRSEPVQGGRHRLYHAADVRGLRARKTPVSRTGGKSQTVPDMPAFESAITLIADDNLYYRGRDATHLAKVASLESVAGLLWLCGDRDPFRQPLLDAPPIPPVDQLMARAQAVLAMASVDDAKALNLQPWGVACTGARLVHLLVAAFLGGGSGSGAVHERLARAWHVEHASDAIRAALILCADHEFNVSTFTVRCVASARSTPYAAVIAGLSALQGPRHGGETERVRALFDEAERHGEDAIVGRLRRGERLPGIGHFLYPNTDPRYVTIMEVLSRQSMDESEYDKARRLASKATELTEAQPNIDFGLATLQRALHLPAAAPLAIFAIGRCVGWVAHAQEQYARSELIRPRARYTGEHPQQAHNNQGT